MMVRQDQGQVKVMGEEGMEMMVDISNIRSADMPLEALIKSKEDMIKSFHLHHGEQTDVMSIFPMVKVVKLHHSKLVQ